MVKEWLTNKTTVEECEKEHQVEDERLARILFLLAFNIRSGETLSVRLRRAMNCGNSLAHQRRGRIFVEKPGFASFGTERSSIA